MNTTHTLRNYERLAPDTLRIERTFAAPIDTVWRWLTDPALRRQWFAAGTDGGHEGELELVFDHDELSADNVPYPAKYAQYKGAVSRERVLKAEPPHLLVWTWSGGKEGTVTFELSARDGQTHLVLTHRGISGPAPLASFSGGWLSHLAVLEAKIAGGSVKDFWALIDANAAALEARGDART